MRKQAIVLISAIFAIFMFAGCGEQENELNANENATVQENENTPTENGNTALTEVQSMPTQQEFDEYINSQQETPDTKNCDSISNADLKQRCLDDNLRGLAVLNMDKAYCDQISSKERQDSCYLAIERRLN